VVRSVVLDPFDLLSEDDPESADFSSSAIGDVSRGTFWSFVGALLLAQVGLAAISLGLLYGLVLDQWTVGGVLVVGGVLAMGGVTGIYWWHRRSSENE
jgi:hypothetical protein